MAHFTFKLESILRHREQIQRERQRDLAIVQTRIAALQAELSTLSQRTADSLDDLRRNHLVGRIDVGFLTAHRRYMLAAGRRTSVMEAEIAQLRQQEEQARLALAQAAMQTKMLEKLREKQAHVWKQDQSRRQLTEADDVGMRLAFAELGQSSAPTDAGEISGADAPFASQPFMQPENQ